MCVAERDLVCIGIADGFVALMHIGRHDGIRCCQVDLQADQGITRIQRTKAFVHGVGDEGLQQAEVVIATYQCGLGAVGSRRVVGVLVGQYCSDRTGGITDGTRHRATGTGAAGYFAKAIRGLTIDAVLRSKAIVDGIVYAAAAVIEDAY
mgnify:FL=1